MGDTIKGTPLGGSGGSESLWKYFGILYVADRTSQKEFEVTSLTYCAFFVWLQADLLAVSFWSLAVQHNLLCRVHVEAVVLPRFMRSLH